MKKTFLVKRNALLSLTSFSWGLFALGCAIIALSVRLIAPNLFWHMTAPLFHIADSITTGSRILLSEFQQKATLVAENKRLVQERTVLTNENIALQKKMRSLEAFSGVSNRKRQEGIIADVVARPPTSPYDTLVLSAGEHSGVTLGQHAFGPGGVPIGTVTSVFDDFSRVTLYSSPGSTLQGWVGDANIPLTITGVGAGALQASIARSANINGGDTVFAPGPGMLPLGTVLRIDSDPSSPEVILHIMPLANIFTLGLVELRTVTL